MLLAGDHDAEEGMDDNVAPETNVERDLFNSLVKQITKEFERCPTDQVRSPYAIDVLEVFCGPNSQLTQQCI